MNSPLYFGATIVLCQTDERRSRTVNAVVVLRTQARGKVTPAQLKEWARTNVAAYKVPRMWEFVEALPKSASGKILWRVLQGRQLTPGS